MTIQLSTNFMGQIVMVLGACFCIMKQNEERKFAITFWCSSRKE
jgi:hypothetical protein